MKPIKELPPFARPREKLIALGAEALSDLELVAVLLGSGIRGKNVFNLARALLRQLDHPGKEPSVETLLAVDGVGAAKACQLLASLEFSRRRLAKKNLAILNPRDALPLLSTIADKVQEHFLCLTLNGASEVLGHRVVTVGLVDSTQIHPREVFADAISDRASAVILAHNHPSGVLTPSAEDLTITSQLQEAGRILGIPVLDHLILSKKGYFSFQEAGLL